MINQKKPFYTKWWFVAIVVFLVIGAIGAAQDDGETVDNPGTEKAENEKSDSDKETVVNAVPETTIDTSVFEYATEADVTDAIDINKHVTVKLSVSEETQPGMAVQSVLTQTFDFLQQDDLAGAETVTIFVVQNEKKIIQYTVNKNEFKPNETDPMSDLVLQASEVEMMSEEVKEFGTTMEWPI